MPEALGLSLEELVHSAVTKAQIEPSPEPKEPPTPAPAPASESTPPSPAPTEELTPNLRRIKASLQEDAAFTKLSPDAQTVVLKRLADHEKAFHKDRQLVSETMKMRDYLVEAGITGEELQQLAESKRRGQSLTKPEITLTAEAVAQTKGLAKMLAQTQDPAAREAIRDFQQALIEEIEGVLTKHPELSTLKTELGRLRTTQVSVREREVDTEIDKLEGDYPSSLIEKYRPSMRTAALMSEFSRLSMEDILYRLATAKEIREASEHIAKTPKTPKSTNQRPTGTPTVTTPQVPSAEVERFKDKKGRIDLAEFTRHLAERAMATIKGQS